jgi:hypothetical protein
MTHFTCIMYYEVKQFVYVTHYVMVSRLNWRHGQVDRLCVIVSSCLIGDIHQIFLHIRSFVDSAFSRNVDRRSPMGGGGGE